MDSFHSDNIYASSFAAINLSAIEHNIRQFKRIIDEDVYILAAVKANAYGHGSVRVAKHIENIVDYFAVADIDEAIELRGNGITLPILIFTYTAPIFYETLIERDITATIYSLDDAILLDKAAFKVGKTAKVHIAVDTGMGRIGFLPTEESADAVKKISSLSNIEVEGLFSHYACAESSDKSDTLQQTDAFDRFISLIESRGVNIPIKHICNSSGTLVLKKHYNMCRLGITLYGLYPSEELKTSNISLIPAMQVISHVIHIKDVPKGFKIGYGHTYEADSPRTIATVSIGYADGFNRCLSNKGHVIINGKFAPVVGRVCMDMIMVDITGIENVSVGSQVIIIGNDNGIGISAEDFGELTDSFNYEVICNFGPRVKRFYYLNGQIAD